MIKILFLLLAQLSGLRQIHWRVMTFWLC